MFQTDLIQYLKRNLLNQKYYSDELQALYLPLSLNALQIDMKRPQLYDG